jgi:hypothetical protein
MRHILANLLLGVLFLNVEPVSAQQSGGPPPPPPPPARDYCPKTWERFSFDGGRFSACFPGVPRETVTEAPAGTSQPAQHAVEYKGLLTYRVSYVDYPVVLESKGEA